MSYVWDFGVVFSNGSLLLDGVIGTLELTGAVVLLTVPLGFLVSIMLSSKITVLRMTARVYVDFFRASALLVVIIWFYFAFPILCGIRMSAFAAAACALILQNGAYLAEALRAAFAMIGRGQREAASALALRPYQSFILIVFPQAIRAIVPILFNILTEVVKGTSLAAAIAYTELSYEASRIAIDTYRPLETYSVAALIYFVIILGLGTLSRWYERRSATVTH
jgi:polar amino acid transport system permease protein